MNQTRNLQNPSIRGRSNNGAEIFIRKTKCYEGNRPVERDT